MKYVASPTGADFLSTTGCGVKIIMGPVGSGKSSVALMDLLKRAMQQQAHDGVRRSRAIILRNTLQQLKSTVKPLVDQWLGIIGEGAFGSWKLTDNIFHMKFAMNDGTTVDSEWWLMAADTPDDVRRLLSVEASWAFVEEAREVHEEILIGLRGRVNRYPNMSLGGVTDPGVICSTNPPPIGSFWHEKITNPPEGWKVFIQPAAILDDGSLNPDAENLENLAPGYYENLMLGASVEWIDVYLKNRYGLGNLGQPVFRSTFKKSFHVAKDPLLLVAQTSFPLIVGMDNGLQSAATLGQMDARGRINILANCFVPENHSMGVEKFLDSMLLPMMKNKWPTLRNTSVVFVLDPACFQRSQVNEITIAQAVNSRGYKVVKASTNTPERRIAAVEQLLTRQIDGGPGVLIDPACTHLIDCLEWGYRFRKQANGQMTSSPEKNHASNQADSLQYLCLHYNVQIDPASSIYRTRKREIKPSSYVYV